MGEAGSHPVRCSTRFVSWKDRKVLIAKRRHPLQGTHARRLAELDAFEAEWKSRYPSSQGVARKPGGGAPPFAIEREIRRLIYTTNAIESLNSQRREISSQLREWRVKGPSDEAAARLLDLSVRDVEKKWHSGPVYGKTVLHQLASPPTRDSFRWKAARLSDWRRALRRTIGHLRTPHLASLRR